MLNLVSLVIGVVTLFAALVAFIPLLGWLNWLILPVAIVGLAIGALSRGRAGRNLCLVVVVVGIARLAIGHGVI